MAAPLPDADGVGVFLYDTINLLFDTDSSDLSEAVQIAHFNTAVALNASHFIITT